MFKSCDYCRHRKKKCVASLTSDRCTDCERLDLQSAFSRRHPSLKRQQNSRQVAHRLRLSGSAAAEHEADSRVSTTPGESTSAGEGEGEGERSNSYEDNELNKLKEGDCQVRLAGRHAMATKRLFQPRRELEGYQVPASEKYWAHVHPFWPFATLAMLDTAAAGQDPVFQDCIEAACLISLNTMEDTGVLLHSYTERLVLSLQRERPSMSLAAGTLLLCSFLHLENRLVQNVFDSVEREVASAPHCVLAGALVTNVWRRLAGHAHRPLHLPAHILETYAQTLDPATFGHHYLRLSRYATEFDQFCMAIGTDGVQPDTNMVLSRLEYDCLLWQVCLPPTLLDTRDDLPATPESVVIHCLSSLLLMSFYSYVLERADTLGALIALRPVPGALLFMCALARSTFICPRQLLDRMALLVSIQAQTVRIMLRLWHQTGFENCRAILNMWEDPGARFPELARQVREDIGTGPWTIEEVDGYSVFWTFRDLRTLITKYILDK